MYMNPVKKLKYCLTVLQQQFREINFPRMKHNLSKEPVLVRLLVESPSVLVLESTFKPYVTNCKLNAARKWWGVKQHPCGTHKFAN